MALATCSAAYMVVMPTDRYLTITIGPLWIFSRMATPLTLDIEVHPPFVLATSYSFQYRPCPSRYTYCLVSL